MNSGCKNNENELLIKSGLINKYFLDLGADDHA
jgi:hypothetical protein